MTKLQSVAFNSPAQQRILALAGIAQAAQLVHQVANNGQLDEAASIICWQSLFVTDPQHISEIYGGSECLHNLSMGLDTLLSVLQQDQQAPVAELTRYIIGMLHLQGKLSKSPSLLNAVAQQLDRSAQQTQLYGIAHANVTASLAEIYSNNLSQFRFRIQVTGNPVFLQQAANANRVRSLLLAGIRSAILWRQVGGRRWHFVLGKQKFEQHLQTLLNLSHQ
ncbi:MAG: high frequency lysogenization protein HflD [Gammaproteobacteria bacterium]|nr:high frequency lysogenization protein HflD [Gammaproteobacteria bacterium]